MPNFRSILPAELSGNAIQRISKQWALASAQKPDGAVNTMTISWGGLGYLWNQPVAFLFVRPQRYTYEFVESADGFSLCFFPEKYRKELQYCGTISGRTRIRSHTAALQWPIRTVFPISRRPKLC